MRSCAAHLLQRPLGRAASPRTRAAVRSRRADSAPASSRMMPRKRYCAAGSMSGNAVIVSTAARMLASEARVPSVSVCSSLSRRPLLPMLRVMSSRIRTKPVIAALALRRSGRGCRGEHRRELDADELSGGRGGDETRDRRGVAAPSLLQRALEPWMMRLRSKMANTERPRPTRRVRLAGGLGVGERLAQQPRRARVVEQNAPLDVADDHALGELGHQRGQPVALFLDARVGLADALRRRPAAAPGMRPAKSLTTCASSRFSADPCGGTRCAGLADSMMREASASWRGAIT